MGFGYVVVAVLAIIITVFALQNTDHATVRFLLWRLEGIPVAGLVLSSLIAGVIIAGLPLAIRLSVWRSRARALEKRAGAPAATVEGHDLTPPPLP